MKTIRTGSIYKHICLKSETTNGIYIGKTLLKYPEKRWQHGHGYLHSTGNSKMANTILKYGIDNWDNPTVWLHEIIETNIPVDKLADREIFWISYYDSFCHGLNSTIGGDGAPGRVYTNETIAKMQQAAAGRTKKLYQYSSDNFELLKVYQSIGVAIAELKPTCKSAIKNCIGKPWRQWNGYIFMLEELTTQDITKLADQHKKEISKKKSIASANSADKRKKSFRQNKLLNGYIIKTTEQNSVTIVDVIADTTLTFTSINACCKALHISKKSIIKYANTNKTFKNYIISVKKESRPCRRLSWVLSSTEDQNE